MDPAESGISSRDHGGDPTWEWDLEGTAGIPRGNGIPPKSGISKEQRASHPRDGTHLRLGSHLEAGSHAGTPEGLPP